MAGKAITYEAVTPDGHTYSRTSRSMLYTHARWIRFPWGGHQVIVSWHLSELSAASTTKSPFQVARWKNHPWGVVPATSAQKGQ